MPSIPRQLAAAAGRLNKVMLSDRVYARREMARIRDAVKRNPADPKLQTRLKALAKRLQRSESIRSGRLQRRLTIRFDPELPISAKSEEITAAIQKHPVLIVAGETGSGKTTQLPKLCMLAGRGVDGWIGVTQPRRIAATTVARRIAEELGESPGQTVGHKIRFQDTVSAETRIKLMTDGILLAEAQKDNHLNQYDTLIVDEAHERSLNIDFILGMVKTLLQKRRDLKVIITSATIDTEKFARAFDHAPIIEVSGRVFPVDTRYVETDDDEATHIDRAVEAVDQLIKERRQGDILVFMPTEQDIRDTCEMLEGRRLSATRVIPLFGRLSSTDQQRVFQTGNGRKIVVATNVAETSITIPGINFVVDTGLARISRYTPRSRTTTMPVSPVSQSSADQRQGRCGRTANGVCLRLYSEDDYNNRPRYTAPEILRANLAEVILRMIALKLGDVEAFPFIDPPEPKSIQDGYRLLVELGAITLAQSPRTRQGKYALTDKGRLMARLPLDPRLACMLLEARNRNCLDELAIVAAALSIQDPRERPAIRQSEADQAQAKFVSDSSDFITLLNIWHDYQKTVRQRSSWRQVKQFCYNHFLSFRRMREWQDVYRQIVRVLADQNIRAERPFSPPTGPEKIEERWYAAVHQSILCGFLSNIAMKKEQRIFQSSYNRQAMLFPGSGLFKNPGQWIVAAEMVETSRLFARCAADIDPKWLEPIGKGQCKYTYMNPHWERNRGEVVATEQVSLYGLIIDRRPRPYGPANPEEAGEIFIKGALIDGDVKTPLPFLKHNSKILADVEDMEDRLRRKDFRMDEQALVHFYRERLDQVYDLRSLKRRIKERGGDNFLRLTEEDLLVYKPSREELSQFPDYMTLERQQIDFEYKYDPGGQKDGVTAKIPASMTQCIDAKAIQWLVPGLMKEKITALIKGLPKEIRKKLVPVSETADIVVNHMPTRREKNFLNTLSQIIRQHIGVEVPAAAWDEKLLPDHLRMRIALVDTDGKVIKTGRGTSVLNIDDIGYDISQEFDDEKKRWERGPIDDWNFGDLPDTVTLTGQSGRRWTGYPALALRGEDLMLTLFADSTQGKAAHAAGVKTLLMKFFRDDIKHLRKNLKLPAAGDTAGRYFGGRKTLEDQLSSKVIDELFKKNLRSAEGYQACVQKLKSEGVAGRGRSKLQHTMDVLEAYSKLRIQLHKYEKAHVGKAPAHRFLNELRDNLNTLVPKNFIQLYDNRRLERMVRYIQALSLRAQRGLVNLKKDRAKSVDVDRFSNKFNQLIKTLTKRSSPEKRQAMEDIFWMLEEFKISVYAQEIKTAHPVSAKRLEKQLEKIGSMI